MKRLLLLEFMIPITQKIEDKEINYRELLPLILRMLNKSVMKFIKFNEALKHTNTSVDPLAGNYVSTFIPWSMDYIKKYIEVLSRVDEIKNSLKEIFSVN